MTGKKSGGRSGTGARALACAALAVFGVLLMLLQGGDSAERPSSGSEPPCPGPDAAFAPYAEPVTLSIAQMLYSTDATLPDGDSYSDNQYTRHIKEQLNIDIVVEWFAINNNDFNQKLNLSIATGNMPDAAVAMEQSQMRSAARLGLLADLSDAYDGYACEQMKLIMGSTDGRAMESATVDGRMVALPGIQVQADGVHVLWIRKDWLDRLGLEVPRTPEQIGNAARAFVREKLGGPDTIGMGGPSSGTLLYANFLESTNNTGGFDPIFSAMDLYPGYWLRQEDGSCVYGSLDPRMKDALGLLAQWYREGLIDPEMGVRNDVLEIINTNRCGIFFAPWWMGYDIHDSVKLDPDANWQVYPVYTEDGRFNAHCSSTTTRFTIVSEKCAHPEAVLKIANLLLRDEGALDVSTQIAWYPLRNPMAPHDECERTIKELNRVLSGEKKPGDYTDPGPYKLLVSDVNKIRNVKLQPYDKLDIQYWNLENLGDWGRYYSLLVGGRPLTLPYNHVYSATYALTESMPNLWPNLKRLEYSAMMKIVMGQDPALFDEFVKQWRGDGGDVITEEVNELAHY